MQRRRDDPIELRGTFSTNQLTCFLQKRHSDLIRKGTQRAVFGSVTRGEERPGGDIDFLVEVAPDRSLLDVWGANGFTREVGATGGCGNAEGFKASVSIACFARIETIMRSDSKSKNKLGERFN